MGKYTDEQNVMIAKKEYEKYDVNDAVTIEDKNTGNKITVGYVAEVIHNPSGEDTYVVTSTKLSKNPTPEELANRLCESKSVNSYFRSSMISIILRRMPSFGIRPY